MSLKHPKTPHTPAKMSVQHNPASDITEVTLWNYISNNLLRLLWIRLVLPKGRSCIVSHVHVGRLGTLAFNSFRWRAIRLFNAMPNHIRCISSCSVLSFRCKLDLYLRNIVDLPGRPGFNNSLDSMNYKQWWTPREDLAVN